MLAAFSLVLAGLVPQEAPASEQELAADASSAGAALPEDLRRALSNRLRVLDVAAHPDDEDGALLLTHAAQGAETFVVYATLGEGGQNATSSALGAELGALRVEETIAANRLLGVTPESIRFLGFPDFGFSKRPDETFARWGGREEVVRRLVKVIRELRPHRVFTNHAQTGGHGHHQATSIALHEAIVAAADPSRFPEQIAAGLQPWRADALLLRWFPKPVPAAPPVPPAKEGEAPPEPAKEVEKEKPPEGALHFDYDLPSGVGERTIAAVARAALEQHVSQGPWSPHDPKAKHETWYQATWRATDAASDPAVVRASDPLPDHRVTLAPSPEGSTFTIDDLLALLAGDEFRGDQAPSPAARDRWLRALLGVDLFILDEDPLAPRTALAPGERLPLLVLLNGRDELYRGAACAAAVRALAPAATAAGSAELVGSLSLEELVPDESARAVWRDSFVAALTLQAPAAPAATVSVPATDERHEPFSAADRQPLAIRLSLAREGVEVASLRASIARAIAPPAIAELAPAPLPLVRLRAREGASGSLALRFPTGRVPTAPLELATPAGFQFGRPDSGRDAWIRFTLDPEANLGTRTSPRFELPFVLFPTQVPERSPDGAARQVALSARIAFEDGEAVADASGAVAWIDALAPRAARVGFVAGADGSVAPALAALGVPCVTLTPEALAAADLASFTTVVLDVRTLRASETLRKQSPRLRDWIEHGGHVVVLHHKSADWNPFVKEGLTPAPHPLQISDQRICEEDAPVRFLVPGHELLLHPNVISARDFDGWVQERALNVAAGPAADATEPWPWVELIACADAGEEPLKGALVTTTSSGGGSFTYCALALHRQLRAGHAGAFRLLANLVGRPALARPPIQPSPDR